MDGTNNHFEVLGSKEAKDRSDIKLKTTCTLTWAVVQRFAWTWTNTKQVSGPLLEIVWYQYDKNYVDFVYQGLKKLEKRFK